MIYFLKHISIEGPGTIGDFFFKKGIITKTIDLEKGDKFPETVDQIKALIVLGGPMNVYEEDKYAFLVDENIFIKKVLDQEIPYLGICLGAQLLAKATGAQVIKSPQKELGFSQINLTKEGEADVLFRDMNCALPMFQWHEDMVELPKGAQLLARSKACPHQAFRVGTNAYGLQFHVEITDEHIAKWCDTYITKHNECDEMKKEMLKEYTMVKEGFVKQAEIIYNNFLTIIQSR